MKEQHHIKAKHQANSTKVTRNRVATMRGRDCKFWQKEAENNALGLFHAAAQHVPAYRDFLKKSNVSPEDIKDIDDFKKLPIISKANYLKVNSLSDVSWHGNLNASLVFTSTSGSTGEPFYFSRSSVLDWQSSLVHEFFFDHDASYNQSPTLVVICFGMGVWIGGLITYQALHSIAERNGYPISIITPGINKEEIFKVLKNLAPNYKNIILAGYPPFIKDIVDEAPQRDVHLKDYNVKILFAAEAFTENFRSYIAERAGIKNELVNMMNVYGSADIGSMAFETPLSILLRKIAVSNKKVFVDVFGDISKTPTFAQYDPTSIVFEAVEGNLILTGNNSIPLIRYSIGDHGGVYSFDEIKAKFLSHGIDISEEAKKAGIEAHITQMPFIYIFERNDFSTTLYGLQIYPEIIREVLIKKPFVDYLTGKLSLATRYDKKHNQYLEINIEERKDKKASLLLRRRLLGHIVKALNEKNSEFRELAKFLKKRAQPKLIFWPSESPEYFKAGVKQKWVQK